MIRMSERMSGGSEGMGKGVRESRAQNPASLVRSKTGVRLDIILHFTQNRRKKSKVDFRTTDIGEETRLTD